VIDKLPFDERANAHLARVLTRLANLLDPEAEALHDPDTGMETRFSEQQVEMRREHQLSEQQFRLLTGGGGNPKELARVLRGYVETFMVSD